MMASIEIGLVQGLLSFGFVLCFIIALRLLRFPDLTLEGSVPLAGAVYATALSGGLPIALSFILAIAAAFACGASTALLASRFHVNKFLAGVIMVSVAYTLSLKVMSGPNVSLLNETTLLMSIGDIIPGVRARTSVLIVLTMLCGVMAASAIRMLRSEPGLLARMAGSNPTSARALGIPVGVVSVVGLAACNGMAGLAGVLQVDHAGFSDVSAGQGLLILALAAMAIGEALTPSKRMSYPTYVVLAAAIGSAVYQLIVVLALRLGLAPTDLRLATALIVLVVVVIRTTRGVPESAHAGVLG